MSDESRQFDAKLEGHGHSWPTGEPTGRDGVRSSKSFSLFGHELGSIRTALVWTISQQLVAGVLAGMMLDGGYLFYLWKFAMWVFWSGALLILARRFRSPTVVDLFLIKFAFLPLVGFSMYLNGWVAILKGMR